MTPVLAIVVFATLSPGAATDAAVAASPAVAVAQAQVRQDAATLGATRAALAPSLASTYVQTPQGNPPGPDVTSRLVTIGLQETLTDFVSYGSVLRQDALTLRAAQADRDVAVRDERIKTTGLYYDALKARSTVRVRDDALATARTTARAAELRFAAGDAPRLDVLRARVAVAQAEADLETARTQDETADQALLLETALPSTTDLSATREIAPAVTESPTDASATERSTPTTTTTLGGASAAATTNAQPAALGDVAAGAPDAGALVAGALANRAEIASLSASADAATAGRQVVAGGTYPTLLVGGGYTTGTDSGVPVGAPSMTASLLLPLGSGARDRIAAEDAKIAAARARLEAGRRAIVLEVGTAARAVTSLERTLAAATRAERAADDELAASELGYRSGAIPSLELDAARASDATAAIAVADAGYDLAKARAVLALELGR